MRTLDYSRPGPGETARPFPSRAVAIACAGVTLVAARTCVRIEVSNARAGGVLPRNEEGKWRVGFYQDEPSWRRLQERRTGDATLTTRPLTPAERARMVRETTRERANGDLRDLVRSFGCLQYVLVPLAVSPALCLLPASRPGSAARACWSPSSRRADVLPELSFKLGLVNTD